MIWTDSSPGVVLSLLCVFHVAVYTGVHVPIPVASAAPVCVNAVLIYRCANYVLSKPDALGSQ